MKKPTQGNIPDLINRVIRLSEAGKDNQALQELRAALRLQPANIELLNAAGALLAGQANWQEAETAFRSVLKQQGNNAYALYNLAKVYKLSERLDEAIACLDHLLKHHPRHAEALCEIGVLFGSTGRIETALEAFQAAITVDPRLERAYRNLYVALYTHGHYEKAAEVAIEAIAHIESDYCLNYRSDLILCLWKARAFEQARGVAEDLIAELEASTNPAHRPVLVHAVINYGIILMEHDDPDGARVQYEKAIALAPDKVEPYVNLAKLHAYQEDLPGAVRWFEKAIHTNPEHTELHNHLAIFLRNAGRPDLAVPHHMAAIEKNPGSTEMRYYLCMTQFALGHLQEAYSNWEYRWTRREGGYKSTLPIPHWRGEPAQGRSLLLYREQGLGDEILYASCLPDLIPRFGKIHLVCHSKLHKLFSRSFPGVEVRSGESALTEEEVANIEWQMPIGDLPVVTRPDVSAFPRRAPGFLLPDPDKVRQFRTQIDTLEPGLVVGFSWRSNWLSLDRQAYYPYLKYWASLFAIPGITWVCLQYGEVAAELDEASGLYGVPLVNFEEVDHFNDIDTSVALMKACDVVVGPETSTTQLAAAAGVPTLRLSSGFDIYCLGQDYYPWYPSLINFSRRFGEEWEGPIARVAAILQSLACEHKK